MKNLKNGLLKQRNKRLGTGMMMNTSPLIIDALVALVALTCTTLVITLALAGVAVVYFIFCVLWGLV